jgi:hypothetical protein
LIRKYFKKYFETLKIQLKFKIENFQDLFIVFSVQIVKPDFKKTK